MDMFNPTTESWKTSIMDADMHGIMSTVYNLDKAKGLDLILQTPGGDPAATEGIVTYLRSIFGLDIRAIIPQMAMSAGTMLACSCKEIVMAKHSSLGPIDPQFYGVPAIDIIQDFDNAKSEIERNPILASYWKLVLDKYPAGIYERCKKSLELSGALVRNWLETNMLLGQSGERINRIISQLNENQETKTHSRHIDKDQCKKMGLKIYDLEENPELQDCVLSIHHCYMHLFARNNMTKIIENHNSISVSN